MIPLSLTLRNFLSYGPEETVVDFAGLDVVCICGANGVGKSALLDAMLWGLYGASRAGERDHRSLIRRGAKDATVVLDFAFAGEKYRVDRRVYRDGKRSEEFRFYHLGGDGDLSPIAQGREGKRALAELLHLNVDSFQASVFLHQGESDLFSNADPRVRREILGNILELELYEQLKEKAKEESKAARQKASVLRGTMEDGSQLESELAEKQDRLTKVEAQLATVKGEKEQSDKALADAARALNELQKQADLLDELRRQAAQLEEEANRIRERIATTRQRLTDCEEQAAQIPRLREDAARLAKLEERREVLRAAKERLLQVERELARLEHDESEQARRLEKDIAESTNRLSLLNAEIVRSDAVLSRADAIRTAHDELGRKSALLEEMRSAEKQQTAWQTELAELETSRQKARQELETRLAVLESRIAQHAAALGEEEALRSRLAALGDIKTKREGLTTRRLELATQLDEKGKQTELLRGQYREIESAIKALEIRLSELDHTEGDCPLCRRPLDEQSRAAAHSSLLTEIEEKKTLLGKISEDGKALKDELESIAKAITAIDSELTALPDPTGEIANISSKLAELEIAKSEQAESAQVAQQLQSDIAAGNYTRDLLPRLEELARLIAETGFDPAAKAQLEKEVMALATAQRDYDELERLQQARPQLEADATALQGKVTALEKELAQGEWRTQIANKRRELEAERAASSYTDEEMQTVEDSIKALKDAPQALKLAEAAEKQIPSHKTDLDAAEQELERKVKSKQELSAKLAGADELSARIQQAQSVVDEKNADVERIQTAVDELKQQHYQVSSDIKSLQSRLSTIQKLTGECAALEDQSRIAELTAQMFSPRGIPHLIIAGVLPQLSQIATEILIQLSDDPSASIRLSPQKAKADGELADSLDIIIADRNGERNYALYSGGESFRIDIALRVALAKLLARRSGVSIRTLVIDEGFGTQDSAGIDRLASAVHRLGKNGSAGGSFDLVMVVTHVEELKNRFEQLLVVERDERGYSTVKRIGANRTG